MNLEGSVAIVTGGGTGIGRAVYDAVLQRDYPMLQGAFLILTISVVFFNLVADLLYFKLDPRITE
jgi:peptide/nickel transport system permease protein